jgi:hypothetical protein
MSYASTITGDSPARYWRLGDASGPTIAAAVGSALTAVGSPTFGAAGLLTGDADTAISFVSASSQSANGSDSGLPTGNAAWSLEAWIKSTSAAEQCIVGYGTQTGATDVCMGILSGALTFDANSFFHSFGGSIADGARHHCVLTWDGTTMLAYIDGAQVGTGYTPGTFSLTLAGANGARLAARSGNFFNGTIDEVAIYSAKLTPTQISAHYAAGTSAGTPTWTTPADGAAIGLSPTLEFTSPTSTAAQHFNMQLDTANTFNTGNLRDLSTATSQAGWEYFNGSTWVAFPSTGLPAGSSGNAVRHTVQTPLTATTWYRRVRAGT